MWRRLRRRSLAPRRPAVFAGQFPLLAVTVLAVLVGVAFCLVVLLG
jgi:hypothetical protein